MFARGKAGWVLLSAVAVLWGGCGQPTVQPSAARSLRQYPYPIAQKTVSPRPWATSLDEGLAEAKREGKPLLVFFEAPWCLNCQFYTKSVFPDPEFIEASRPFVAVRVDVDRDEAVADRYGVRGIPDVVFMNSDGDVLDRVAGYQGELLVERLSNVLADFESYRATEGRSASGQPTAASAG